ncbi:MAG: wcaJ [Frankiales bacterium]|nr:wcaJ [Frankiales bacterium]
MTAAAASGPSRRRSDPAPTRDASAAAWLLKYRRLLIALDVLAVLLAGLAAVLIRFGSTGEQLRGYSYVTVGVVIGAAWILLLGLSRCYEPRFLGVGPEEARRVTNASLRLVAGVALLGYSTQLDLARGFVAVMLPLGTVLLLLGRYGARLVLHRLRRSGRCVHRVILLGTAPHVRELAEQLARDPSSGLRVVGACVPGGGTSVALSDGQQVRVVGHFTDVVDALRRTAADTLAVAHSPGLQGEPLRRLAYQLEGTGIDLLVAPALTSVGGSRISIRPAAGLPLLHLDEPELGGVRQLVKGVLDRTASLLALVVLSPLLLAVAVAVRSTSPGPVVFKQERVGRGGKTFCLWKFRSMVQDAEARRDGLAGANEHDGVLFKIREDPRVTRVGRFLRRTSIDELPQLVNVLRGEMSLVGPRPPLPAEVARYEALARRRLLVKPGVTGLWQVSGRSNLTWEDTVRLDLQYVENWSLGLDVSILLRTLSAVMRGDGAY